MTLGFLHGLTFTWWGCCSLCSWHKPTKLAPSSLFCSYVNFCLYAFVSTGILFAYLDVANQHFFGTYRITWHACVTLTCAMITPLQLPTWRVSVSLSGQLQSLMVIYIYIYIVLTVDPRKIITGGFNKQMWWEVNEHFKTKCSIWGYFSDVLYQLGKMF